MKSIPQYLYTFDHENRRYVLTMSDLNKYTPLINRLTKRTNWTVRQLQLTQQTDDAAMYTGSNGECIVMAI